MTAHGRRAPFGRLSGLFFSPLLVAHHDAYHMRDTHVAFYADRFYLASFPGAFATRPTRASPSVCFLCPDYPAPINPFLVGRDHTAPCLAASYALREAHGLVHCRRHRLGSFFFPLFSHPLSGSVFVFYYSYSHDIWRSALLALGGKYHNPLPPHSPPPILPPSSLILLLSSLSSFVRSIFAGAPC